MYEMLCGIHPFRDTKIGPFIQQASDTTGRPKLPFPAQASSFAMDLVYRLLTCAEDRLTAEQVLAHSWFQSVASCNSQQVDVQNAPIGRQATVVQKRKRMDGGTASSSQKTKMHVNSNT